MSCSRKCWLWALLSLEDLVGEVISYTHVYISTIFFLLLAHDFATHICTWNV